MILTYIDESGSNSPNDDENEYLLASISIHESDYPKAEQLIQEIKVKYFGKDLSDRVEIHATDIISGKKEYKNFDVDTRLNIISDILGILGHLDCKINCVLIRKNMMSKWTAEEIYDHAFKYLFERLFFTHAWFNHHLKVKQKDVPQYGIVFMDAIQPKVDNKLKEKVRVLMKSGTEFSNNKYIIEDVVFIDSRYRALSQIVDVVAYCVRRHYRLKYKQSVDYREIEIFKKYMSMISPKIRKNNGRINGAGFKVVPNDKK